MKRVIWGIFVILSIFILPWWIVFLLAFASLFYFEKFYEIIILSLIADILYGSFVATGYPYIITLISIILLYVISNFKKNLLTY